MTREKRSKAKTANFGIIYGISVFGLAERMNVDRKEAKELIDGYFETYPKVKAYMDRSIQVAREKGYIETIFHRKRYLPDINSRNAVVRGYAERNAINAPIQGSAADIIKVAMIRIYQRFQRRYPLENDSPGTRRIKLQRLAGRKRKSAANCDKRDGGCLQNESSTACRPWLGT